MECSQLKLDKLGGNNGWATEIVNTVKLQKTISISEVVFQFSLISSLCR